MSAREQIGFYDELDSKDRLEKYIIDSVTTSLGDVKVVSSQVTKTERVRNFLARQGLSRNDYKVTPGIYAVGSPVESSNVFVTANYKVSFDALRASLKEDAWVLVLDTHGINVWCAAGKGTFGTLEVVRMVKKCRLRKLVKHRKIILPQLGAPGVNAFEVRKLTGFNVVYGPVRAEDIPAFVRSEFKATKEMRRVTFTLAERLMLTPLEFLQSMRYTTAAFVLLVLVGMFSGFEIDWFINHLASLVTATVFGTVLFPVCLPYLKGHQYTVKALPLTVLWMGLTYNSFLKIGMPLYEILGTMFIGAVLIELFALNFTGATPITSYTETKEETLKVIPYLIGAYISGMLLFCLSVGQVI